MHGILALNRAFARLFALVLLLTAFPLAGLAGEEVSVDGVLHVKDGDQPPGGVETLELEELWRVGGEDDEETVLGIVVQALADDDGNIYLLDLQLSQVFVYSPQGEMLRTLSREGEGPGEVRRPADMLFLPDSTLGLLQTFPGKLVKVSLDDEPAGVLTVGGDPAEGGFAVVVDAKCRAGNLVMAGTDISQGDEPTKQTRTSYLASYADDGSKKAGYWQNEMRLDFTNLKVDERDQYNVFPRRWALGPNGDVYAAVERDEYVIHVHAPDGTLKRVIEKTFTNRKRTDEEMEFYQQLVELQTRQLPDADIKLADTPEAINYIEVASDGSVWVVDSHGDHDQPEGILLTYSVFSPEGHYVKNVQVKCDGDGQDDGLIRVADDRMILIRGLMPAIQSMQTAGAVAGQEDEEAAPMEVICYQVKG